MTKLNQEAGAAEPTSENFRQKTRGELDEAKENIVSRKFRELIDNFRTMSTKQRIALIGEIIFAATIGKLLGNKPESAKTSSETEEEPTPPESESEEDSNPEAAEPEETEKKDSGLSKELDELAKMPDINQRVVKIAEKMVQNKVKGEHCWDWCDKVYKAAHVKRQELFSSFTKYEGKDCGENCAKDSQLDQIKPGAHIFINNKNKYDVHGNHSVIFLGWVDQGKRTARVAGCPFTNKPGVITTENLIKKPVTAIANPI